MNTNCLTNPLKGGGVFFVSLLCNRIIPSSQFNSAGNVNCSIDPAVMKAAGLVEQLSCEWTACHSYAINHLMLQVVTLVIKAGGMDGEKGEKIDCGQERSKNLFVLLYFVSRTSIILVKIRK